MTRGEQLIGRSLKREKRGGVGHYVTGQHEARDCGDGFFELSYVDVGGNAVLVVCEREDGSWKVSGVMRAGQVFASGLYVPGVNGYEFELSEKMLAALEAAS